MKAICLVSTLLFAFHPVVRAAEPAPRPNVVLILADDLGYMDIGVNNGESFYETPRIDGLAARGLRLTTGYAACPVCSPTRASIMTGKYPQRTGVTNFIGGERVGKMRPADYQRYLALDEVTLAEALRDGGFATFFAGKWHLGDGDYAPSAQGFPADLSGKGQMFYPEPAGPRRDADDPKATDRIADAAVRFIEANAERPFFAYLPFQAPHVPIGAKRSLVEKYERKRAASPAEVWGQEGANRVRETRNSAVYAAMLEQLDTAIGRVLDTLENKGLSDRTIVIFTSDNGGLSSAEGHPTSNLPLRAGKGWLYEGGLRTPWIIRAPGVTRPGEVCDAPVISHDLYPTILALTDVAPPTGVKIDGVSLVPLLRGEKLAERPFYWHYPHYANQGGGPGGAIRDGDWKLIDWFDDNRLELFNLRADPSEKRDLAAAEPERVKGLAAKLAAWRVDVGAKMPTPIPATEATK